MLHMRRINPIVKWVFTLFLMILIPNYWIVHGPENFLWISDVALFFMYIAIIFESQTFASLAIVGDFVYLIGWLLDFFYTLFSPSPGLTKYMLDNTLPVGTRILSLCHIALPPLMIWTIRHLGYNRRVWPFQIIISMILLFTSWLVTSPEKNINIAFSYRAIGWEPIPYLILVSIANGALIFLTHITIRWAIRRKFI